MIERKRPHATRTVIAATLAILLVSAPSIAQVTLVKDINPGADGSSGGSFGGLPAVYGTQVVFGADDGTHGIEPWVSDGTAVGTEMLADVLLPGICGNSSGAKWFIAADGLVYFLAAETFEGTCVTKVWRTNATPAGTEATTVITRYATEDGLVAMNGPQFVGGSAFFLNAWDPDGMTGDEVWTVDAGNQYAIKDIWPGSSGSNPISFGAVDLDGVGERMFFSAYENPAGDFHPWISDGKPTGTSVLKQINTISGYSGAGYFTGFDGKVWFQADDGVNGAELWSSDGTTEGTALFMNIYTSPSEYGSNPGLFTVAGDKMFFAAKSDYRGFRLWVTDGTQANTHEVVETEPGVAPDSLDTMVAYNDKLFFSDGHELWVSDGTEAGTFQVADINPGSSGSDPEELTVADGKIFFSAETAPFGRELWVSNGTAAGTMLVEDIFPGTSDIGAVNSSWPHDFVQVGDMLFFFATDGTHGNEPRKLPLTDFVTTPDAPTGPESGLINTTHSYVAGGAISLEGDDVQYRFHWGDGGDPSEWLTIGATSADHQWTEPGTYTVTVEARAASDTSVVSRTSAGLEVEMLYDETISGASVTGASSGWVGNEYPFIVDATSSKGHAMEFQINWGDGTDPTDWTALGAEGSQVSYAWTSAGLYQITAKVRCAVHPESDEDEGDHSITISNESLSDPTLVGPETGGNGISYTYTLGAESSAGHDLEFRLSWGDGPPDWDIDWTPFGTGVTSIQRSHAWPELGGYEVYAQVRCATHPAIEKEAALWVTLDEEFIHSVTVRGPDSGYTGLEYTYTIHGESSWGHELEYALCWGDEDCGDPPDWKLFPAGKTKVTASHAWTFEAPDFPVWAGVRCADHHMENGDDMTVAISDGPSGIFFHDGFETGDVTQWSSSVGSSE